MQMICRCGHVSAVHRHHRKGTDCALCPRWGTRPASCSRFRLSLRRTLHLMLWRWRR